jgi:hypothetical protein
MHDAVALERRGVPAVVVAHDSFAYAARTQANVMGLPDLPVAVMPRPDPTWSDERIAQVMADLARDIAPALTARPAAATAR